MESTLEAVIFDLDGVITDTARYHYLAWYKIADQLGIYFDEQINQRLKGVDRMNSLKIVLERLQGELSDIEKHQLADKKNEYYQELIATMTPEEIAPGTKELLTELKSNGIKIGLASVSKNAKTVIDKLQIGAFFDYMADATKIINGKPDPEIFLNVAENLGVQPSKCIGVEDAAAGIAAIKSAGMYAIGIGDPRILNQADKIISGFHELNFQVLRKLKD